MYYTTNGNGNLQAIAMERFSDFVSKHANVLGFKVESPVFVTLFLTIRKPSFRHPLQRAARNQTKKVYKV